MGEHDRALASDRGAELDGVDPCDQVRERLSPLLERALAKILATDARSSSDANRTRN